jgi:site-specific DNA-methyltransferase (adenine-specific)
VVLVIYCGDCLEIMPTLPDKSIDMILCDLPYGTTACKWDTIIPFEPLWAQYKRLIKPNGAIVLTASQPFTSALVMSNPKWFRYDWIWIKNKPTGSFNTGFMPMKKHENILVFYKHKTIFNGQKIKRTEEEYRLMFRKNDTVYGAQNGIYGEQDRNKKRIRKTDEEQWYKNAESVLFFRRDEKRNGTNHPTQKPVALMEYLIRTYTQEGETVLDNCAGSGTTGVACVKTRREFILIEKDPKYVAMAERRIKQTQPPLMMAL